uniref:Uncharacterized protein n=1 Tax=Timema poppense TaxID=170557 RepID=A0A7R9DRQ1_TIMPO|nr:unnamed protein product [Timema poppensis]
MASSATLDSDF